MHDPRIDQLAKLLVRYSTSIQAGEKVLIEVFDVPDSIAIALIREVRAVKATPFVNIHQAKISRELGMGATAEQYGLIGKQTLAQMKSMDAYIAIRGSDNISELADIPDAQKKLTAAKMRPTQNYRVGKTKWCVLRWPTSSMAQQAQMSTEAFEDFYFSACLADYKKMGAAVAPLKAAMDKANKVHIKAPGTDLHFSMKGLKSVGCSGTHNIPDGECFSAPVKESVEGVLSYNTPTVYQGVALDNVVLEFEKGKIVNATASDTKAINKILDSDPGARYIGEFAIAFNNEIREPMRDILFDEKIGGSFHFTPGQAYEGETDNGNRSQVHWDMVQIQRKDYGGGEIWFDGELIRKDGMFVPRALHKLNPGGKGPAKSSTKAKKKATKKARRTKKS